MPRGSGRWTDCELNQFFHKAELFLELMYYDCYEVGSFRTYRLSKITWSYERAAMADYYRMLELTKLKCPPIAKDVALRLQNR